MRLLTRVPAVLLLRVLTSIRNYTHLALLSRLRFVLCWPAKIELQLAPIFRIRASRFSSTTHKQVLTRDQLKGVLVTAARKDRVAAHARYRSLALANCLHFASNHSTTRTRFSLTETIYCRPLHRFGNTTKSLEKLIFQTAWPKISGSVNRVPKLIAESVHAAECRRWSARSRQLPEPIFKPIAEALESLN